MSRSPRNGFHLDETDMQILTELMIDARRNTAPEIADSIDVSPGTVRNRIDRLEEQGVIEGYHADVNFNRVEGLLSTLFLCNVPFAERETIARAAYEIPGVTNIRIMMGGRRSFHVLAVGENMTDLRRIGTTLSELGVEIEDEMLVENELVRAYAPFDTSTEVQAPSAIRETSQQAEFTEITVQEGAPVEGLTIRDAVESDVIGGEPLITAIVRETELITPHGDTRLQPGDVVTLFESAGIDENTVDAFTGN